MEGIFKIVIHFIGNVLMSTYSVYSWNKILEKKNKIYKLENILSIIIIATIITFISNHLKNPLKLIITFILLIIINNISTSKNIRQSIITTAISQIILGLSELSFAIMCSLKFDNNVVESIKSSYILYLGINVYMSLASAILIHFIFSTNIISHAKTIIAYIRKKDTLIYSIATISVMIITTIESYMEIPKIIILITNLIIILIFIFLIIRTIIAHSLYNKINDKYQTSISSLKEYENMIDKFRINNHENKNELMTIRNMIKTKDDKTIEYIDTLVNNKIKDNEKIMYKTSKIPEGGLRATIYSKLCLMDKYKIKYNLDIANDVRTVDLIKLNDELILNICKILGVFLDNSIEAVRKLKKKNIDIEIYIMDKKLCIDITNNFKGNIEIDKIGKQRITTKGNGHGYGLSLVNQIIKNNSDVLENEKSINSNNFTQTLMIKMK